MICSRSAFESQEFMTFGAFFHYRTFRKRRLPYPGCHPSRSPLPSSRSRTEPPAAGARRSTLRDTVTDIIDFRMPSNFRRLFPLGDDYEKATTVIERTTPRTTAASASSSEHDQIDGGQWRVSDFQRDGLTYFESMDTIADKNGKINRCLRKIKFIFRRVCFID